MFAFQETKTMTILVTVSLINTVIFSFSIKSAIKTQVKVDMSLLCEVILRAPRHDSQLMLFMDYKGKGGIGRLHLNNFQKSNYKL